MNTLEAAIEQTKSKGRALIEARERIAALEAENKRLRELIQEIDSCIGGWISEQLDGLGGER